jgi:DNA repair photolyase
MGEEKANIGQGGSSLAPTLFPILEQGQVGIARLAAEGEKAGEGHRVEFRTMAPRSLLNRTVSKRMPWMAWTINPYRGCEFGCRYCYARYTHEFIHPVEEKRATPQRTRSGGGDPGLPPQRAVGRAGDSGLDEEPGVQQDPELFEREIYIKQHAAWLLRQELKEVRPGEQIALGTATDPYQPIERRARVTRSLLEVFAEEQGLRLGIVTKSTLIERDIDLLLRIAERNRLVLHVTITTPDAKLARILEPRAPSPDLRFRTVERLRAAGLRVGILCSPLMPGITDSPQALEGMARRAKKAGASFFASQPLFLKPCSKPVFMRFVHEHFPELEKAYQARYRDKAFVSKAYQERVAALVRAVVRKHGLEQRFSEALEGATKPVWPVQAELWVAEREARTA